MTRVYCPDCKRAVTGKKQWLDFFIVWVAIITALSLAFLVYVYSSSLVSFSSSQILNDYQVLLVFDGIAVFSPFIAYFIISEKCPICNLKILEAERLNEEEKIADTTTEDSSRATPSTPALSPDIEEAKEEKPEEVEEYERRENRRSDLISYGVIAALIIFIIIMLYLIISR
jgi:predicted nucleic acid-binding Zn ribbon protein